ncbi:sugar phosphate nucleotidyltransferase [Desulfobacca acetoxidans]
MKAVILAGGKGTRLRPYTTILPKPLMPLGEMPILEIILRQLAQTPFRDIVLTVGYLYHLIKAYFDHKIIEGLNEISYVLEEEPLGTAGPIKQVPALDSTFLVMNGDVLTTLDFEQFLQFHRANGAMATVAMYSREVKIDFGVLKIGADSEIVDYTEKPQLDLYVSMGIYLFEPVVLKYIKPMERLDLPDLIKRLLANGEKVQGYSSPCYWLDIGRPDDYRRSLDEFDQLRAQILKPQH